MGQDQVSILIRELYLFSLSRRPMILIALCQNCFMNCSELVVKVDYASCTFVNIYKEFLVDL